VRVGLISPYDMAVPGGVQDQVIRLARWIREAGHEARIVAPGTCSDPGFISVGSTTVIPINGAAAPVALSRDASRRVVASLDRFDVVHIHEPLAPQVSLTALRRGRMPMVGTFHADTPPVVAGVYRFGRLLTSRWFKNLNVITAVSPIAARVVDYTGRVRIIPNGIDVDDYTPTKEKDPAAVVFLGRNDERKGLPVLLEAWSRIESTYPEATLTVVGAEETGERVSGVTFAGRVSEEEKRDHLKRASIYCAPNLSGESFGIVVAEGMAAGCAVVASGLPAFVRVAGDAARIVSPGDAGGLAEAISQLLTDPLTARQLGAAAQQRVRRFDGEEVAAAYVDAYSDAIEGP